ncbi:hypothetical protein JQ598_05500 [Bradyrhizobium sp. U87765 SZCCT0134]|nr:hypothetical protein [Bradyrhizobium sp. U87765 SZCCT0134]MBR1307708.1 hypothetical protein [Bradyrhizobium sp. U87765 SZCCT0110]MBR1321662.1 hypothetical protein [Bradyrhizobium sp. U87765 SZCCT0109]
MAALVEVDAVMWEAGAHGARSCAGSPSAVAIRIEHLIDGAGPADLLRWPGSQQKIQRVG